MNRVYTRKGRVLRTMYIEDEPRTRRQKLADRMHYWEQVRENAIPGGKVEKWAEQRIEQLRRAIREIDEHDLKEGAT